MLEGGGGRGEKDGCLETILIILGFERRFLNVALAFLFLHQNLKIYLAHVPVFVCEFSFKKSDILTFFSISNQPAFLLWENNV